MANFQKTELFNRSKHLKYRMKGIFPADFACSSVLNNDKLFFDYDCLTLGSAWNPLVALCSSWRADILRRSSRLKIIFYYPLVYKHMRCTIDGGNQLMMKKTKKNSQISMMQTLLYLCCSYYNYK